MTKSANPADPEGRVRLDQVTLCAVTSVNVAATVAALEACLAGMDFAACKLLTDKSVHGPDPRIDVVAIPPIASAKDYSYFVLQQLADYVATSHCLLVQWDGHLLDARRWNPVFLEYDYVGASWPQFDDHYDVGNGGFSLRSRRLMDLCRHPAFRQIHPEDLAVGRINRPFLEQNGQRFAPRDIADRFATERSGDLQTSFGYHGVFNMPRAIGIDAFWKIYRSLDDRSSLKPDFGPLLSAVGSGGRGDRVLRMVADRSLDLLGRMWT